MPRSVYGLVFLGLLAGCVPMHIDPARDQFGVSTARPEAGATPPSEVELAALKQHADQVCTWGFEPGDPALVQAEADQQIVTMNTRCNHYDRIHFAPERVDWTNLF